MTKRVYHYFFDYTNGQQKWLNEMAAKGWRLVHCGQLAYDFESCAPGKYEYAVEFVAHKSYAVSKDYKAFLESMGYKTFYKNIKVGIFIGSVHWRPWGEGTGQITTAPGSYQKELIIVEKGVDDKPFELHTDLTDLLMTHSKARTAYLWAAGGMLAITAVLLFCAILLKSIYAALGAAVSALLGSLWLIPAIRISKTIRGLKAEAETNEYMAASARSRTIKIIALAMIPILAIAIAYGALCLSGASPHSYSARNMAQMSWGNHWNAKYEYLNGRKQRRVSLTEGTYIFVIEITTSSGELGLSITGLDDTEYFKRANIQTSAFEVTVDIANKDKLTLQIDASEHCGSYNVTWQKAS